MEETWKDSDRRDVLILSRDVTIEEHSQLFFTLAPIFFFFFFVILYLTTFFKNRSDYSEYLGSAIYGLHSDLAF